MPERKPFDASESLSREGFVRNLALLAATLGFAWAALSALLRRGPGASGPPGTPVRAAHLPPINPPSRSVKRRG